MLRTIFQYIRIINLDTAIIFLTASHCRGHMDTAAALPAAVTGRCSSCRVPEVLDVVLHPAEVQSVGQGLVVGQGLGRRAPVHIWRGGRMRAETNKRSCEVCLRVVPSRPRAADPCGVAGNGKAACVCVAACQTEHAHRCARAQKCKGSFVCNVYRCVLTAQ